MQNEGELEQVKVIPQTAFISGPIEPTEDYFNEHYVPKIEAAISAGHSFVMGPAPGMDTMALDYLTRQNVDPSRITVYFADFQERLMADRMQRIVDLGVRVKVEGITTSERDAAMTCDSDYDILRYMAIPEQMEFYGERYYARVSATERNERRRKGLPLHHVSGLLEEKERNNVGRRISPWRSWMKKITKILTTGSALRR